MEEIREIPDGLLTDESGYPFTGIKAPDWVEKLDRFFAGRDFRLIATPLFRTSANLCRRIGDHDLYTQWLENALANHPSPWWSAAFATSLLVGYFSTGKSLLDSGSVALNVLFGLSLSHREQDFSKGKFWNKLNQADRRIHQRMLVHKTFIERAVKWRDVAVHRLPPRVCVLFDGPPRQPPDRLTQHDVKLGLPDNPEVNLIFNPALAKQVNWVHPNDLVRDFGQGFHKFAAEVADIIITSKQSESLLTVVGNGAD